MNRYRHEFECPSCGNPLIKSDKPRICCIYCMQLIVPEGRRIKREAKIIERKQGVEKDEEDWENENK